MKVFLFLAICFFKVSSILGQEDLISLNTSGGIIKNDNNSMSFTIGGAFSLEANEENRFFLLEIQKANNESFTQKKKDLDPGIRIYPNPTTDYVILEVLGESSDSIFYNLFDLNGRIVKKGQFKTKGEKISVYNLPDSIYILSFSTLNGFNASYRLIKN